MILIHVEDNHADRVLMDGILRATKLNYELHSFSNLEGALELANGMPIHEVLFLLDLSLPPYQDLEIVEALLAKHPESAIVVITGTGQPKHGPMAIKMGALDYLDKSELNSSLLDRCIRYSRERQRLRLSLMESNVTKDKLISLIAHDLRSPIGAIISLSSLLEESQLEQEFENSEELILIKKSAEKASSLLNNLLEWSRLQAGKVKFAQEELNLNSVVESEVEYLAEAARLKDIKLRCNWDESNHVFADRNSLGVILRNLISNAIKFSHQGEEVQILSKTTEDFAIVEVIDTGIGIPKSMLKDLFDKPLESGRTGTAGELSTGFGLSLAKNYAEKNQATISVSSQENIGTTFRLQIPNTPKN